MKAPQRVTQYRIVSAPDVVNLVLKVSAKLDEGWQPQGGVSAAAHDEEIYLFQAVVK